MTGSDPQHAALPELVTQLRAAEQPATPADKAQQREAIIAALNGAVLLEFATIPPYLTALWTIKDERHPLANSLRNILQEEMLHLALVCNMLVSIGGEPQISSAAPTYPGKLPLGVHPELIVPLGRFSKRMLQVFIEIERPKDVPPDQAIAQQEEEGGEDHAEFTIGQLYGKILASFRELDPEFSQDRQVTGPLAWLPILSLGDVKKAIDIIERQGEGSTGQPEERRGYLAHYWRFAEMHRLQRMEKADGKWSFGAAIDFDFEADVWPTGDVPEGGYQLDAAKEPDAHHLLRRFNITYSKLLDYLQATWSGPAGQAMILKALEEMFELEKFAKPLMQIQRPDGQHYSPDFRYLRPDER